MTSKLRSSVGNELRSRREELGLSLHKVEVATKIRGRYLRAIETNDYAHLPNDVYSRGFVRQYATYLGLAGDQLAKRYQAERGKPQHSATQVKPRAVELRLGTTSRWAASLVALGAVAVVVAYFIWQFSSLTAAPKLSLQSPSKDGVVITPTLEVKGQTAPGADVLLNDVPLPSNVNGGFATSVILQPGINEIKIVAKSKLGKETRITRNILSKSVAQSLPAASFDGVAVLLAAREANAVTIVADGVTIYQGSLAKGGTKLVTAKQSVVVGTNQAASLMARITNGVVADYNFGAFGSDQGARTVEFSKTTQILK